MASISLSLAFLPVGALAEISAFLRGTELFRLEAAGCLRLNSALYNGGVTIFKVNSKTLPTACLNLSRFTKLVHIEVTEDTEVLALRRLDWQLPLEGSALRILTLNFDNALAGINSHLVSGKLANLQELYLVGKLLVTNDWFDARVSFYGLSSLVKLHLKHLPSFRPSNLPRALLSLTIEMPGYLVQWERSEFGGLPPNLTFLELTIASPPDFPLPPSLTQYILISPHFTSDHTRAMPGSLKSFKYLHELCKFNTGIFETLPVSLTELIAPRNTRASVAQMKFIPHSVTRSNIEMFPGITVSAQMLSWLPPGLVSNYCARQMMPTEILPHLPSTVETVLTSGPLQNQRLPSSLTRIDLNLLDQSIDLFFPTTLTELSVHQLDSLKPLERIPSTLKTLSIRRFFSSLEDDHARLLALLPKRLAELNITWNVELKEEHLAALPPNLASLVLRTFAVSPESPWSSLPRYLTNFNCRLNQDTKGTWKLTNGFENLRFLSRLTINVPDLPCPGFGDHLLTHLPPHIEHFWYECSAATEIISAASLANLPRTLTSFKIPKSELPMEDALNLALHRPT